MLQPQLKERKKVLKTHFPFPIHEAALLMLGEEQHRSKSIITVAVGRAANIYQALKY